MAIDLCNKLESISVPLDVLSRDQRVDLGLIADDTLLRDRDSRLRVVGDPAAWASDYAQALDRIAIRLDTRSSGASSPPTVALSPVTVIAIPGSEAD